MRRRRLPKAIRARMEILTPCFAPLGISLHLAPVRGDRRAELLLMRMCMHTNTYRCNDVVIARPSDPA